MKNKTIENRVTKIAVAFGYENRVNDIVNVIESIYKKSHVNAKETFLRMIELLKNNESFDGLIPKKKREESEETRNVRYEKALAKLNQKYGKGGIDNDN